MYNNMKPQCSNSNVEQKPKRTRTAFTTQQLCALEDRFREKPTIDTVNRQKLAAQLGLTDNSVRIWFQNRRMKEKRNNTLRSSNSDGNEFAAPNHFSILAADAAANGSVPICSRMVPVLQNDLCCQRLPEQQQPELPNGHAGYLYPVNSGSVCPLQGSNSNGEEFDEPEHFTMLNGYRTMAPALQNNEFCQRLPGQQLPELPHGHAGYPYPVNSGSMYPAALPVQWPPNGPYNPCGAEPHQPPVTVYQHPALPQPPTAPQEEQSVASPQELEQLETEWLSDAFHVLDG